MNLKKIWWLLRKIIVLLQSYCRCFHKTGWWLHLQKTFEISYAAICSKCNRLLLYAWVKEHCCVIWENIWNIWISEIHITDMFIFQWQRNRKIYSSWLEYNQFGRTLSHIKTWSYIQRYIQIHCYPPKKSLLERKDHKRCTDREQHLGKFTTLIFEEESYAWPLGGSLLNWVNCDSADPLILIFYSSWTFWINFDF